jgi:hypothetical protein
MGVILRHPQDPVKCCAAGREASSGTRSRAERGQPLALLAQLGKR